MSSDPPPDGRYAETLDDPHAQPRFLGRLALTLMVLAILVVAFVLFAAVTRG